MSGQNDAFAHTSDTNRQLLDALEQYHADVDAGKEPDCEALIAEYPQVAKKLKTCLDNLNVLHQVGLQSGDNSGHLKSEMPPIAILGDFRIIRELGRGGMGIVYEAEQISLKRRVAMKILPYAALLDHRQLQRFRTEARAAAMLKHRNIVSVYSIGCERGVNYYAMELIDGPSLAEILTVPDRSAEASPLESNGDPQQPAVDGRGDTDPIAALSTQRATNPSAFYRQVARLGTQVAEALQYAHAEGVIHRDIKPANLLLDKSGSPHVADFGLARMQSGADLTMTGDLVGTLRYMSPEQVAGNRMVDQHTDVYSLGLTLYELVAHRPAFDQTSQSELMKAIAETEPTPLNKLDKQVPIDLATIVHKAIAKEPEDRYQQASDLAEDLDRFLDHRTISAKRSTHPERLRRLIRRNRVIAALVSVVFALLLGLSVVSSVAALRFAAYANQQAIEARKQRLSLYAREMRLAHLAIDDQQVQHAEGLLLKWVPDSGEGDLRGFEWYHLWARCYRSLPTWTISHDSYIYDVAYSSDGRYLADASMYFYIHVWDTFKPATEEPIHRIDLPVHAIATLETSKDGSLLIGGGQSGYIGIWDWSTYEMVDSFNVKTAHARNMVPAISIDNEKNLVGIVVYHGAPGSSIVVWDRKHDTQRIVATCPGRAWVNFDAKGHLIVASPARQSIDVFDPQSGEQLQQHLLDGTWNAAKVFPDGSHLAVCLSRQYGDLSESRLEIRRLNDWQLELNRFLGEVPASAICISHDGQEIAVGDMKGQVLQVSSDGSQVQRRTIHNDAVKSLKYSPDGRHMASTERSRYAYVFPRKLSRKAQTMVTRCSAPSTVVTGIGYVDDGRTVCTNEGGSVVRFWDAHTGELRGEPLQLKEGPWNIIKIQTDPARGRVAMVQTNWPFDLEVDQSGRRKHIVPARVAIWDYQRNTMVGDPIHMDEEAFTHVFSADGKYLAVCGLRSVTVVEVDTNQIHVLRAEEFRTDNWWLYTCAFSFDTKRLYCGTLGGETHVFEVGSWKQLGEPFLADSHRLQSVSCSRDGRYLGSCGFDRRLKLFDQSSHALLRESEQVPMYPSYVRFSQDGERAVVGSPEGVVRVYMTETAGEILRFDVPNHYTMCEFAPDGSSIAVAAGIDAMVIHAPDRRVLASLSTTELRDWLRKDSRMYRIKDSD